MSSRAPVGASNRQELFTSSRKPDPNPSSNEAKGPNSAAGGGGVYGDDAALNQPGSLLQLEHVFGCSSGARNNLTMHPRDEDVFCRSLENLVAIENLADPMAQKLLRGHDMPVSSVAFSPSGDFLASGQVGTTHFKGNAAPIFIWRYSDGRRQTLLKGITERVNLISFSTDERFVCGCGEDCLLYIWDLSTSEVIYGTRLSTPASIVRWVEHKKVGQYMQYELVLGYGNALYKCPLTYDPSRVNWTMKQIAYTMSPSGSVLRNFTSVDLSTDSMFVYVGSSGGEVMIFRRDAAVFRACVPICGMGVQNLCVLDNDDIVVAGGDGAFKRIRGSDMSWQFELEFSFPSAIRTMVRSSNNSEVLVYVASGEVFRVLATATAKSNFQHALVTEGCNAPITSMAISNTVFATGTSGGEIRVWDVADYACNAVRVEAKFGQILALEIVDVITKGVKQDFYIVVGFEDGFIRCYDKTLSRQLWYIAGAHRGGTRTLNHYSDDTVQYLLSGGNDGVVRVWRLHNRELVTEHSEHGGKGVSTVLVDVRSPNIIHSCGKNGTVVSYDLKGNKRIMSHMVESGISLNFLTQRLDHELELVSCDNRGRIMHWDIDYRDPVLTVQDPSRCYLRVCKLSPTGRFLAFAGDDGLLKVMDIKSGDMVGVGQGHSSGVEVLSWTYDERQLISGGKDACLCVWNFYLGGESSPAVPSKK